ncbi:MAG: 1-acyl-sn-glycerol-3-phosphate acyltransferase [Myxococcales bacterium]|nr:1-acyl-sn-glycerol-3-phosphate acyltransferase [Myxococcales bacterium]
MPRPSGVCQRMPKRELTQPYEPNPALRALYRRFFDRIQVDESWVDDVRRLADRGSVVYVLRNLNFIDFLALDHLTKRFALPQVRFANDLGLWILNPMGKGWLNALFPRRDVSASDELADALTRGGSAALFLKRPPGVLDVAAGGSHGRGLTEGDELVRTLIRQQARQDRPILLVPQVFVWSKEPDTRGKGSFDFVLGPREWPSPVRTVGQFLYNYKHVALKAGEALDLRAFLAKESVSEEVAVRRITYAMLARVERERRSVTGPAEKPPDRVRMEILRTPRLRGIIEDLAGEKPTDRYVITARALSMLRELQATPDMAAIKGLEAIFDRVFHRIYAGIEYDKAEIERVREAAKQGSLVLLPSHKSHIDYLILSYVFNESNLQLPLIAAGENLNFFPVGTIFRRSGAFFIRRSFKGDKLYTAVVDAYIRRLIRDGYPIELFLEGSRSRTGKLLSPKFGLLNMIVDAALAVPQRTTYFVPVSIGYERIVEAGSYVHEMAGGEKKKEDATDLLRAPEVLRHRYGRINLQFGQILSLSELAQELGTDLGRISSPAKRRALVTRLGNRVMDEINQVTAVTPGALTAMALLTHPRRGIPFTELVERATQLLSVLASLGARATPGAVTPSGTLRAEAIREAAQMFADAELVDVHTPLGEGVKEKRSRAIEDESILTPVEKKRLVLDTSKNIIIHFFVERALVAVALLVSPGPPVAEDTVRERVQALSRLFKHEFRFRADAPFDAIFDETLLGMQESGALGRDASGALVPGPGAGGCSGREWLELYAAIVVSFLEGYRVAARGLALLLKGAASEKELTKKSLALGNRMFFAGELSRRESVSKPLVENALASFVDQGYIMKSEGKLELTDTFATQKAVATIESKIALFLGEDGA